MADQMSEVARAFSEIARAIREAEGVDAVLDRVSAVATRAVPGCTDASVTVPGDDGPRTQAFTSAPVLDADRRQYETGEGPCLDAMKEALPVYAPDIRSDRRWPRLAAEMVSTPFRSVLSFRLLPPDEREVLGSLNLYGAGEDAFDDEAQRIALLLAGQASVALVASRSALDHQQAEATLREALSTRDVIGQAKGILMERHKISADAAFEMLRQVSQSRNVKLRTLARDLTESGELPGDDEGAGGEPAAPV